MTIPLIYDFDYKELTARIKSWGLPKYRGEQVWNGLYKNLWLQPEEFTTLSKDLRAKLGELLSFDVLKPIKKQESKEGDTRKTLYELHDGQRIETVIMHYERAPSPTPPPREERLRIRNTVCISTQVGCRMGCTFCATGQMGFKRQLSSGEIVAQVLYAARELEEMGDPSTGSGQVLTNVVVMGMGEPFHNYDETLAALERLNAENGFNFGARRFTISTVGLVPMIWKFAEENLQYNLAISLHAADDELRSTMLPINEKYPINKLLEACRYYVERTHRQITFEWALIEGVNDTPEQAHTLARKLKGLLCHVNAIPLNPTRGFAGSATTRERAKIFRETLEQNGISCSIRAHRGIDIQAGCGQLASRE